MLARFYVWRGARLLDKRHPNWAEKIDLEALDIYDAYACILAQLYDQYWTGLDKLGLTNGTLHGFDVTRGKRWFANNVTEEWRKAVLRRVNV